MLYHLTAVVRGNVQGVGFRWFVRETARSAGITGWVQNLSDGSVALEAEGTQEILIQFLQSIQHNHSGAEISEVTHDITPISFSSFSDFIIKH
jgi:acylphosphatase